MPPNSPSAPSTAGSPTTWSLDTIVAPDRPGDRGIHVRHLRHASAIAFPRTPIEKWPIPPNAPPVPSVALPPTSPMPSCGVMNAKMSTAF